MSEIVVATIASREIENAKGHTHGSLTAFLTGALRGITSRTKRAGRESPAACPKGCFARSRLCCEND
jgi:hypothetical protein